MLKKTQQRRAQQLDPARPITPGVRLGDRMRQHSRLAAKPSAEHTRPGIEQRQRQSLRPEDAPAEQIGPEAEAAVRQDRLARQAGKLEDRQQHFAERLAQIDRLRDQAVETGNTALLEQADRMEQSLRARQTLIEERIVAKQPDPAQGPGPVAGDSPPLDPPRRLQANSTPQRRRPPFKLWHWFPWTPPPLGSTPQ
jgi:hypothetical protein